MLAPALALTLALAPSPPPAGGEGCRGARAPHERLVCAVPALAALERRAAVLHAWEAALADAASREAALRAQRAWLEGRRGCVIGPRAPPARAGKLACLRTAYRARIAELARRLGPVPDALVEIRQVHRARRPGCEEVTVAWPRLEEAALAGATAFNALVEERPPEPACAAPGEPPLAEADLEAWRHAQTSRTTAVIWKTARYVTTLRTWYELDPGAAHPDHGAEALTFDLVAGRPIGPDQVLRRDPATRAALLRLLGDRLGDDRVDRDLLAAEAFERPHWLFDGEGAIVHFSPFEVAPYSAGEPEARLTWAELRPFLRPDSPLPAPGPRGGGSASRSPAAERARQQAFRSVTDQ